MPIEPIQCGGSSGGALNCSTDSITICPGEDPIPVTFNGTIAVSLDCLTDSVTVCPPGDDAPFHVIVDSSPPITVSLSCETDSVTVCPPGDDAPFHVIVDNSPPSTPLDCLTDSVTICPGEAPIDVTGTVSISGSVAVTQSTSPWVISGTATVLQGTNPWVTDDLTFASDKVDVSGSAVTIEALTFAEDKVDVSGSAVSLDAGTLAALETITVLQGTSPWVVSGTVTATTAFAYAEDSPSASGDIGAFVLAVRNDTNATLTTTDGDYSAIAVNAAGAIAINDGGNSITVDAVNLDIRDLVFATDKVDVSGSAITIEALTFAEDKVDVSGSVVALDAPTLAALESVTVQNPGGVSAVNIQDGGNSITVDGTVALDAPTLAALESVTVQNPGGVSAVNIQDGGNSITVDGSVATQLTDITAALYEILENLRRPMYWDRANNGLRTLLLGGTLDTVTTVASVTAVASDNITGIATINPQWALMDHEMRLDWQATVRNRIS